MKYKTAELEGALLDAAVAKALGHRDLQLKNGEWRSRTEDGELSPIAAFSTNWSAGGQIIERERIELEYFDTGAAAGDPKWRANIDQWVDGWRTEHLHEVAMEYGPTPLIAAMRAFVASKLGEEVEL